MWAYKAREKGIDMEEQINDAHQSPLLLPSRIYSWPLPN